MELPVALPVAMVPAVRQSPLPDQRPADAILPAPPASDAWAAVPPDVAADAAHPVPAAVPYAEKLAGRAPVVPARAVKLLPARALQAAATALCKPGEGPSAA